MADVHYSGTARSAADVSAALSVGGYRVIAASPSTPVDSTRFWLRARELFRPSTVEQGGPRDYRALLIDPQRRTRILHVRQGARIRVEERCRVAVAAPQDPPSVVGLDTWHSQETGRARDVFTWDGSDAGLVDLIAFFQLHGNLLCGLTPADGAADVPVLRGTATQLESHEVYEFSMTRQSRFVATPRRTIEALNLQTQEPQAGPDGFADRVFAEGIDLMPTDLADEPVEARPSEPSESASEPWYRRWAGRVFRRS